MSLTKQEVQKIIASHLSNGEKSSINSMFDSVVSVLEKRKEIGEMKEHMGNVIRKWQQPISNEDALLINDVIYDFLYSRIITPGIDRSNLNLPFIHVYDREQLKQYL